MRDEIPLDGHDAQIHSSHHVGALTYFCSRTLISRFSGAGLSGLALAISLQKFAPDVDFEIYEGATELAEIGAGIGIAPRTWAMVQALGIEDALLNIAGDGDRPCTSCYGAMTWLTWTNLSIQIGRAHV